MAVTLTGGTPVEGNNLATITLTVPGVTKTGWAVLYNRDSTASFTAPSGWTTSIYNTPHDLGGLRGRVQIFQKLIESGDGNPVFTRSGGGSGNTTIGVMLTLQGLLAGATPMLFGANYFTSAVQQNIGPIVVRQPSAIGGMIFLLGAKANNWTSVAAIASGATTWTRITEIGTSSGNGAGLVIDIGTYPGSPTTITNKTYNVTGGSTNHSMGFCGDILPATGPVEQLIITPTTRLRAARASTIASGSVS